MGNTYQTLTCSTIRWVSYDHTTFHEVHLSCTHSNKTTPYASRAVCLPLINILQTVVETVFFSKLQCVPLSAWSPSLWPRGNACEAEQLWRGPFSCRTTGGHCFSLAPHRARFVGRHSGHRQWGRFTGIKWGCQIFATFLITCTVYFQSLRRKKSLHFMYMNFSRRAQCLWLKWQLFACVCTAAPK